MKAAPAPRRPSLSQRVVWSVTLTVALVVGLQSIIAYMAMHVQEDDFSDAMLRREVQLLSAQMARPGLTPVGAVAASQQVEAYLSRRGEAPAGTPAFLDGLSFGLHEIAFEGQELHVAVVDTEDGKLTVALNTTESEARVVRFGYILLATWAFCVAITALAARRVAAVAVAPIALATRRIVDWSNPSQPSPEQPSDEVTALLEAFNLFRDRSDEQVTREREFTSNLSHEIRTPLTTIRTDAELLGIAASLAPAEQTRTKRIAANVDEIMASLEAALSASSGRAFQEVSFPVATAVQAVCDSLADRSAMHGLSVENLVDPGSVAVGDRQAFLTVCRNIIRNAIEHAGPARLWVRGDGRCLSFRDDGPGIDAADLPHLFERYHSGRRSDSAAAPADTSGLGLAIARRLCDLRGWTLEVRSPARDGRGAEFLLRFDRSHAFFTTLER